MSASVIRHKPNLLRFFAFYAHTDFTHLVIFFLGDRPNHPGKLHLVTDNRRAT
ncbi:hypothetical protein [Buttiauxella agrestis]|uniref:hypothetical protein n=1 Tax=Buttiauxella agrestis TaxID=82977 RepID=UPI003CD0D57B